MSIYLDNSAATKPYREVIETMRSAMENCYGNPSSLHDGGLQAERLLREARDEIKASMGLHEGRIVFTSGGTEADNMALICGARSKKRQGRTIITSPIEHPAVLETCKYLGTEGFKTVFLEVDIEGKVVADSLKNLINDDVILISCMHVNNETGAIQPIELLGQIKTEYEKQSGKTVLFHVDEAQSLTKVTYKGGTLPHCVDMASYSAHKIHGPKGIGAIYIKKGVNVGPYIFGGGQEDGYRSGTENTPAAAGFAQACRMAAGRLAARREHVSALKNRLLEGLLSEIEGVKLNGHAGIDQSSPFILNLSFLGVKGEVLLHELEMQDILVSTGAACSTKKNVHSHVLKAMGLTDAQAEGAIRFSFSEHNTVEEIEKTISATKEAVKRFRGFGRCR